MNTVQSGLRLLAKSNVDQPNLVMAGTVIAAVPIVIALLVFQRQLVRGLTAGAVKG
jgi:sn-glycerol 3-phosphate transport system permease protein